MSETVLITGASSGIGRALAGEFARAGYGVVLVARRAEALADVARGLGGRHVATITADLAQPDSARMLFERLEAEGTEIHVLVNNAGFALQGEFATLPLDRQLAMIQLNVTTLTELTRLFLPGILARQTGGVLNVASTAAFQPGPLLAVYYATKAYVLSFTEAIAEEVAGTPVKVSCLCPGPTETEFAARAAMTETRLFRGAVMRVEEVAHAGYAGWTRGETVIVPGSANRRGTWAVRFAPRAMVRRIVKRLNSAATDGR